MFTELAVIDWIALAVAAVLLSAALAAALLAYLTSPFKQRGSFMMRRGSSGPAHASDVMDVDIDLTGGGETPPDLEATDTDGGPASSTERVAPVHAAVGTPSSVDQRLAERAAKLRGRPVPEPALEHKSLIQKVVADRTPAHAEVLTAPSLRSGVSSGQSNFDRAEGFKARNPGFFDDPMGRHELRYWDGHTWTEYVKEHGERFTDPL